MITFIIVSWAIGAYVAIAIATYIALTKIDPYDPECDEWGYGDGNKGVAVFWPFTLPILLIGAIAHVVSGGLDKIREDIIKHNYK